METPHAVLRAIKWGGVGLSALFAMVWLASGYVYAGYIGEDVGLAMMAGQFECSWRIGPGGTPYNYAGREGFNVFAGKRWEFRLGFEYYDAHRINGSRSVAYIPMWVFVPLPLIATGLVWRAEARASRVLAGRCERCGYSRAGLASDRDCPECGKGNGADAGDSRAGTSA